ncbi:MAG TPA: ATP-dependent DNA helicase RecG [Candidatus Limnocylindrales bacterium]
MPGAATLARALRRLDVTNVRQLLFYLPRRYEDLRRMSTLAELVRTEEGSVVSARVQVRDLRVEQTFRRRVQRTTAFLTDGTGEAEATWFGRRFIERRLHDGDWLVVSGKVKRRGWVTVFDNPEFTRDDGAAVLHAGRIVPVYRLTAGLTVARLRSAVRAAIDRFGVDYPEYLPGTIREQESLLPIATAIEAAHYPDTPEAKDAALWRLAFDELLALQVGMVARRRERGRERPPRVAVSAEEDRSLRAAVTDVLSRTLGREIALTPDQSTAIDAIRADLGGREPMLRLLQGDVGSGKTAVAAYALAAAARAGLQGALLAPTDLLARQHAATIGDLLEPLAVPVTLLTGSLTGEGTRASLGAIADGRAGVVVGTHALIQARVTFARLALVVIDEQHRFGVGQRGELEAKAGGVAPHVLLMTATPIPRTLGQVLYADLDVSDLRTAPEGRLAVRTAIRRPTELDRLWAFVREEAAAGHATFVVVPAIEETDDDATVAAESEHRRLGEVLAPLRVGLVHGRMKASERDREVGRLRDGDLDVLVGTTVLEVGVDVPRATVMVVEGADRFGLSQLHQLRGRVGRATVQSYCALVSDAAEGTVGWERLRAVERTTDGFALAEADFELRGEGDVLGLVQSGLPRLRVASLQDPAHRRLAAAARSHAEALVDPSGKLVPGAGALARELEIGWLATVRAAEPAAAS